MVAQGWVWDVNPARDSTRLISTTGVTSLLAQDIQTSTDVWNKLYILILSQKLYRQVTLICREEIKPFLQVLLCRQLAWFIFVIRRKGRNKIVTEYILFWFQIRMRWSEHNSSRPEQIRWEQWWSGASHDDWRGEEGSATLASILTWDSDWPPRTTASHFIISYTSNISHSYNLLWRSFATETLTCACHWLIGLKTFRICVENINHLLLFKKIYICQSCWDHLYQSEFQVSAVSFICLLMLSVSYVIR